VPEGTDVLELDSSQPMLPRQPVQQGTDLQELPQLVHYGAGLQEPSSSQQLLPQQSVQQGADL
jgi:hypothetical protein